MAMKEWYLMMEKGHERMVFDDGKRPFEWYLMMENGHERMVFDDDTPSQIVFFQQLYMMI